MNVFFKSNKDFLYIHSRKARSTDFRFNRGTIFNLGIDGSTTSFGLAWYNIDVGEFNTMMLMRDSEENATTFMEIVFPFLQTLFSGVKFNVSTYEKTPDDFTPDTRMVRIMKKTESSVSKFLRSTHYIYMDDRDRIFDIFPNSWKSFIVPKDIEGNLGKVNKRENALAVIRHLNLDEDFWIKEYDRFEQHSYDGIEALGIGLYGSEFIYHKPFIRTYRNFGRRRPLHLLGTLVPENSMQDVIEGTYLALGCPHFNYYIPNHLHSGFENFYALDSDDTIGFLLTEPDSLLRPYLEHIHGLYDASSENILLSTVLRSNEVNLRRIPSLCQDYGFRLVNI